MYKWFFEREWNKRIALSDCHQKITKKSIFSHGGRRQWSRVSAQWIQLIPNVSHTNKSSLWTCSSRVEYYSRSSLEKWDVERERKDLSLHVPMSPGKLVPAENRKFQELTIKIMHSTNSTGDSLCGHFHCSRIYYLLREEKVSRKLSKAIYYGASTGTTFGFEPGKI